MEYVYVVMVESKGLTGGLCGGVFTDLNRAQFEARWYQTQGQKARVTTEPLIKAKERVKS